MTCGVTGQDGALQRFAVDYALADALHLRAGIVLYPSGDLLPWRSAGDNDRLFLELTHSFGKRKQFSRGIPLMASVTLKSGRDKSVLRRHPWLFSGAIATVAGDPAPGDTVTVRSRQGTALATGAYSPHSQIRVRIWDFDPRTTVDRHFFERRLGAALDLRRRVLPLAPDSAYRLVNAESDGLPGLLVDCYAGFAVCQFLSAGTERWKAVIVDALQRVLAPCGIFERSDTDVRKKEGLRAATGVLAGSAPPKRVEFREGACRYLADVTGGHKTGFYLDQRENRVHLAAFSQNARMLNGFAYTGAFGVVALQAGARHVTHIDSSADALALAQLQADHNGIAGERVEHVHGDVFRILRRYRDMARRFDLIVLDPPKFADSQRQISRAARGYKDVNLLAIKLLAPGGILFTFSCSGAMTPELFQKIVADAALDAGRPVTLVRRLFQGPDHPVGLAFPEGAYLKGLVCRVA